MTQRRSIIPKSAQPSVVALLFAIWGLVIPLGYSNTLLSSDGDLARHLTLGRHILQHGPSFPDVFSHTKPGETFLAYEWLSEVILSLVHGAGGLAAVALFTALLVVVSVTLVAAYLRRRVETGVVLVAGCLVAVFTYPHWIARPHLFSFLALALLLHTVTKEPGGKRTLALGALFAVWANLHPGFFYGLAILLAYLVGDTLDHGNRGRLRANGASAGAAFLGTLVNPFGWGLHLDILRHLKDAQALEMIEEFQPVDLGSNYGLIYFLTLALLILILAAGKKRPPYAALVPFLAAMFAGFSLVRNIPLFGLFAFPILLAASSDVIRGWEWKPLAGPRATMAADDEGARTAPLVAVVLVILGALVITSGRVGPVQLVQDEFSPVEFPVAAVAEAREAGLNDMVMFNEYRWGGYILFAWPEQRVFIDSMANFFGGELMAEYLGARYLDFGWEEVLRDRGVEMILLPPDVPLVAFLRGSAEWEVWYEDEVAVVLLQRTM